MHREVQLQEQLDRNGIKSLTFRLMRSLQAVFEASTLIGGTMVTAPPFFETAHRGKQWFWGTRTGAAVVLWDTLTREEQETGARRVLDVRTGSLCGDRTSEALNVVRAPVANPRGISFCD